MSNLSTKQIRNALVKRSKPNPFELDEEKMAKIVVDYL